MAVFCHFYPGLDPADETLARFYGFLAYVPRLVKLRRGEAGDGVAEMAERAEYQAALTERMAELTGDDTDGGE